MRFPALVVSLALVLQSAGPAFAQQLGAAVRVQPSAAPVAVSISVPLTLPQVQPLLPQSFVLGTLSPVSAPAPLVAASAPRGVSLALAPAAARLGVLAQARAKAGALAPLLSRRAIPSGRLAASSASEYTVAAERLEGAPARVERRLADAAALIPGRTSQDVPASSGVSRWLSPAPAALTPGAAAERHDHEHGAKKGVLREILSHLGEPHARKALRPVEDEGTPEDKEKKEKARASALIKVVLVGVTFAAIEVVGAMVTGSLALRADAMHLILDTMISAGALLALWLARRPGGSTRFAKAEPIAGLISSVAIGVTGIEIGMEAFERLMDPVVVGGLLTIALAAAGLAANIINTLLLRKFQDDSLSVRAAFLHALTDAIGSVGIIVSGLLVYFFQWAWVDGAVCALIVALIMRTAFVLGRASWKALREKPKA